MNNWQKNMLDMLIFREGVDEAEIFQSIVKAACELGFEYVAYGLRLPLPISTPKVITLDSYPGSWRLRYAQQGYLAIDPTIAHGLRSCAPLVWSEAVFQHTPELWSDIKAQGLSFGWTQSFFDTRGLAGVLSLTRSSNALTHKELVDKAPLLQWLVWLAHLSLSRVLIGKFQQQATVELTLREIEVLRWTADGKTAEDIGEILKISAHTVNFHMKNAMFKLNVQNKTSAVLTAAMLGLLYTN